MSEVSEEGSMTSLDLLRAIYRNPEVPLPVRMRAAMASLPHEHPKLAVTTLVNVGDFADQLEAGLLRSAVTFAPVARDAAADDVVPTLVPAPGHGLPQYIAGFWYTVALVIVCHALADRNAWRQIALRLPTPVLGWGYGMVLLLALLLAPGTSKAFIYFQF